MNKKGTGLDYGWYLYDSFLYIVIVLIGLLVYCSSDNPSCEICGHTFECKLKEYSINYKEKSTVIETKYCEYSGIAKFNVEECDIEFEVKNE